MTRGVRLVVISVISDAHGSAGPKRAYPTSYSTYQNSNIRNICNFFQFCRSHSNVIRDTDGNRPSGTIEWVNCNVRTGYAFFFPSYESNKRGKKAILPDE